MAKQTINIGHPNGKDGDLIRDAFIKVNSNFTELYNTAAADATDRLVNGSKELVLNVDGDRAWVDFPAAFGDSLTIQGSEIGSVTSPIVMFGQDRVLLSTDNSLTSDRIDWTFDSAGTITVPAIFPLTFTAVLDSDHLDRSVGLTDTAWDYPVEFQVEATGGIITVIDGNRVWPTNPGYIAGDTFTYTEADHGIPGYTFTLELTNIVSAGPAGFGGELAASMPPDYPRTLTSPQSLKLHGHSSVVVATAEGIHEEQFIFQGRRLYIPQSGDIVDYLGNSVLGGTGSFDQSLNTTDSVNFLSVQTNDLQLTNSIRNTGTANVNVTDGTPAVVFTAEQWMTSMKLVFTVEGSLFGDGTNVRHTQTCEATVAATYNTSDEPSISVYGLIYTSATPLAVFSARRGTGNTIEIVAANNQATTGLHVRVHVTQFVSYYD